MLTKIQKILDEQQERLILWSVVSIALGVYFSVIFYNQIKIIEILFCFLFLIFFCFCYFRNRSSYKSLIYAALALFLFGFLFSFFNQKIRNNHNKIDGKIYAEISGKVLDINKFKNSITGEEGMNLLVLNPVIYKSENKATTLENKNHHQKNITKKYIYNNFSNLKDLQEIDFKFLNLSKNYQEVQWLENQGRATCKSNSESESNIFLNFLRAIMRAPLCRDFHMSPLTIKDLHLELRATYPNPPKKLRIFVNHYDQNLKIGDEIYFKVLLLAAKKPDFLGSFDYQFDSLSKGIGGSGYVDEEIKIIKTQNKNNSDFIEELFQKLRKKIEKIILNDMPPIEGSIAAALLMGNQNLIDKDVMNDIRNSGLAHLISISGLHLTLAAGIFFFSIRFLLLQNQYLTLHFDIKKIAAFFAIISSYFYLEIAGSPVPAVRSFIAVFLVMLAILFDKKVESLRAVAFAALLIILINPYNLFSISFQLSFAAILGLVAFHEIWSGFYQKKFPNLNNKKQKFIKYFFEIILVSCFVQLINTPFLIYYFNDVSIYGALSNMVAIPLSSFTTMPLGFLSFFLMPFGLEKIALIPMSYTISWIVDIAVFVSDLKNSHFYLPQLPKFGLALAIFGGLIFCFSKNNLKWLGALIFLSSFLTLFFTKQPNLLIDGDAKFFALYDKNHGLIFSHKAKKSKKTELWMLKMNEKNFKNFSEYSDQKLVNQGINCFEELCEIDIEKYYQNKNFKNKKILILFKRNKISEICKKENLIIVNLTRKYGLPKCVVKNQIKIDNIDLFEKGSFFIYFDQDKIELKSVYTISNFKINIFKKIFR